MSQTSPMADPSLDRVEEVAPGAPGMPARWSSSAKSGVGTALDPRSRVWFTLAYGIVNEVYYPRVDQANTRDLGLLVTDGRAFFSEEKRDAASVVEAIAPGVPGYRLVNRCREGRYRITKTVLADPEHDVLLQHVHFLPLAGALADYRVYALLAPHLGNQGADNSAWTGDYKGEPMLFAERAGTALALACSSGWRAGSAGYVGASDGWQEVSAHKRLRTCYRRALHGNVALTGEVALGAGALDDPPNGDAGAHFVLALAFGGGWAEAGQRARLSLARPFEDVARSYVRGWEAFHGRSRVAPEAPGSVAEAVRVSAAVLRTHEDRQAPGALIASLSIPWGQSKGDQDLGGYHLVWPRDLVQSAGGLLAAGHGDTAQRALRYLAATQEADGHWPQNMWLDGTPYWQGVQLDETAFPILLADLLRREGGLAGFDAWPMVRRAAAFLVATGPVTQEDRWEEDGGYSPSTLAVAVSALLAAADFAEGRGEPRVADYCRDVADAWNANLERWTYVRGTEVARRVGVDGYYTRIAPPPGGSDGAPGAGFVAVKNRPANDAWRRYEDVVGPDALALVRFGLRAADDPRVLGTVRVIDALTRAETPTGPVWHRYTGDGYGEHDDGAPFDGTGVGRGWPLLAGERAHYELAAGRVGEAERLRDVMRAQASDGGLLPEQVWDAADLPARGLVAGRPAGSAMPLAWAHAEFVKLVRSLHDGQVFDLPPQPVVRYGHAPLPARVALWAAHHKVRAMDAGQTLRVQTRAPAVVRWSADEWEAAHDTPTSDTGLGVHAADLDTRGLPLGVTVRFTLRWPDADRWEGEDYAVAVVAGEGRA